MVFFFQNHIHSRENSCSGKMQDWTVASLMTNISGYGSVPVILLSYLFYLCAVFPMLHTTYVVYASSGIYFLCRITVILSFYWKGVRELFFFLCLLYSSFFICIPHFLFTLCATHMHLWHHFESIFSMLQ